MNSPSLTCDIQCQDNLSYMKALPEESMDLVVTSPPYNIGKEYEKRSPLDQYLSEQETVIDECLRLLKPTGSICWQVGNHVDDGQVFPLDCLFYPLFARRGLILRNRIVWTFGAGLNASYRFSGRHETILWFTKGEECHFDLDSVRVPAKYPAKKAWKGKNKGEIASNPLGKNPGDVWDITNIKAGHGEKTAHPCQFPLELVSRLVRSLCPKGGSVLDPYMGSGTTAVAALTNGCSAYGCDITPEYVTIAKERIAKSAAHIKGIQGSAKPPSLFD